MLLKSSKNFARRMKKQWNGCLMPKKKHSKEGTPVSTFETVKSNFTELYKSNNIIYQNSFNNYE
jgi:hypothetical protein